MIDQIIKAAFDVLQADIRLYRGGNAWSTGFTGVKRVDEGDTAAIDYVNLYDTPFVPDTDDRRPAVYAGMPTFECDDRLNFQSINSVRTEHRILDLPLVIVARGTNRYEAQRKRNQLRANVMYIILSNIRSDGNWYQMTSPGGRGGNLTQRQWSSATGQPLGVNEAACVVPLEILYSMSALGTAA